MKMYFNFLCRLCIFWEIILSSYRYAYLCSAFSSSPFQDSAPKINQGSSGLDTYDIFVKLRTGLDPSQKSSDAVFWTGEGELYESPSGKMLAKLDGMEVSRSQYLDEKKDHVRVFSRKIFWYRDIETDEIMTEYNGETVNPIKYDWQVFDFTRGKVSNEKDPFMVPIIPEVIKSPRVPPSMPIQPKFMGSMNQLMFQVPVFIDWEISESRGYYRAWEIYDYFIDRDFPTNRPPSLAWTRNGSNPPFIKDERGVMHFQCYRVDSFDGLPKHMQELVKKEYPMFCAPPKDMDEVDALIAKTNNDVP